MLGFLRRRALPHPGSTYADQTFSGLRDDSGHTLSDLVFTRCRFESSSLSLTRAPRRRTTLRKVTLRACEVTNCVIGPAVIEETLVEDLKTRGLLQCWGTVFRHVTLRGAMGRLMISDVVDLYDQDSAHQRAFNEANAYYYAAVDWALDIREAEFEEADFRGLPSRLIRRDPETQVVITRARALEGKWRQINLEGTYWDGIIELFLGRKEQDVVLVAPKRSRKFQTLLRGLRSLRDAGVAEPE